jgi:ATP-dependent Lon protease
MIPLRGMTIFPKIGTFIDVSRPKSLAAVKYAQEFTGGVLFTATQKSAEKLEPNPEEIERIGVTIHIEQVMKMKNGILRVLLKGGERAFITKFLSTEPYLSVEVLTSDYVGADASSVQFILDRIKSEFTELKNMNDKFKPELFKHLSALSDPNLFADTLMEVLNVENKQAFLNEENTTKRLEMVYTAVREEISIAVLNRKIEAKVNEQISKSQKEYYLREQIKALHDELGDDAEEGDQITKKVQDLKASDEIKSKLMKEVKRLSKLNPASAEYSVQSTYIETALELPWGELSKDNLSIANARKVLNQDHYGLEKIKERILEHLAVSTLSGSLKGPIICLVGPPGVGKTSIGKSIAKALNKKYIRLSLGGVKDEAEIRGHRRTYIGAMPGRILKSLSQAGTMNPVFLLDEVDKLANDMRGDPASALLEVLDAEQNFSFRDHYVELPFDLSKVMFIATANTTDTIPRALLDRMEVIMMNGYTMDEKIQIAKKHLLPKQIKEHGIERGKLVISENVLGDIVTNYTYESGVRVLERQIAAICRKVAMQFVDKGEQTKVTVKKEDLRGYLGIGGHNRSSKIESDESGAATGLAWTSGGGDTLIIEVTLMNGKGDILLTGQLGEVMKESARTAISLVRARAEKFGIDPKVFATTDIHIHVPEGAISKDGPSAGITMATAVLSAFTGKTVRSSVAMTGEITLRGKVLPIGGLKEKALAALRAGIKTVIIPSENDKERDELPDSLKGNLNFIMAGDIETVFKNSINGV